MQVASSGPKGRGPLFPPPACHGCPVVGTRKIWTLLRLPRLSSRGDEENLDERGVEAERLRVGDPASQSARGAEGQVRLPRLSSRGDEEENLDETVGTQDVEEDEELLQAEQQHERKGGDKNPRATSNSNEEDGRHDDVINPDDHLQVGDEANISINPSGVKGAACNIIEDDLIRSTKRLASRTSGTIQNSSTSPPPSPLLGGAASSVAGGVGLRQLSASSGSAGGGRKMNTKSPPPQGSHGKEHLQMDEVVGNFGESSSSSSLNEELPGDEFLLEDTTRDSSSPLRARPRRGSSSTAGTTDALSFSSRAKNLYKRISKPSHTKPLSLQDLRELGHRCGVYKTATRSSSSSAALLSAAVPDLEVQQIRTIGCDSAQFTVEVALFNHLNASVELSDLSLVAREVVLRNSKGQTTQSSSQETSLTSQQEEHQGQVHHPKIRFRSPLQDVQEVLVGAQINKTSKNSSEAGVDHHEKSTSSERNFSYTVTLTPIKHVSFSAREKKRVSFQGVVEQEFLADNTERNSFPIFQIHGISWRLADCQERVYNDLEMHGRLCGGFASSSDSVGRGGEEVGAGGSSSASSSSASRSTTTTASASTASMRSNYLEEREHLVRGQQELPKYLADHRLFLQIQPEKPTVLVELEDFPSSLIAGESATGVVKVECSWNVRKIFVVATYGTNRKIITSSGTTSAGVNINFNNNLNANNISFAETNTCVYEHVFENNSAGGGFLSDDLHGGFDLSDANINHADGSAGESSTAESLTKDSSLTLLHQVGSFAGIQIQHQRKTLCLPVMLRGSCEDGDVKVCVLAVVAKTTSGRAGATARNHSHDEPVVSTLHQQHYHHSFSCAKKRIFCPSRFRVDAAIEPSFKENELELLLRVQLEDNKAAPSSSSKKSKPHFRQGRVFLKLQSYASKSIMMNNNDNPLDDPKNLRRSTSSTETTHHEALFELPLTKSLQEGYFAYTIPTIADKLEKLLVSGGQGLDHDQEPNSASAMTSVDGAHPVGLKTGWAEGRQRFLHDVVASSHANRSKTTRTAAFRELLSVSLCGEWEHYSQQSSSSGAREHANQAVLPQRIRCGDFFLHNFYTSSSTSSGGNENAKPKLRMAISAPQQAAFELGGLVLSDIFLLLQNCNLPALPRRSSTGRATTTVGNQAPGVAPANAHALHVTVKLASNNFDFEYIGFADVKCVLYPGNVEKIALAAHFTKPGRFDLNQFVFEVAEGSSSSPTGQETGEEVVMQDQQDRHAQELQHLQFPNVEEILILPPPPPVAAPTAGQQLGHQGSTTSNGATSARATASATAAAAANQI
ncbi:unnamed protein product [Amoebophrya sp. A120]|nr:unnamed protein product [Amoebophrya sp. A120]|eukprot:GSA120T00008573001.1